jgi:hypothetical protein
MAVATVDLEKTKEAACIRLSSEQKRTVDKVLALWESAEDDNEKRRSIMLDAGVKPFGDVFDALVEINSAMHPLAPLFWKNSG